MTSTLFTYASRRTAAAAVLVLAGGLILAGCGGGGATPTAAATAPAATTAPGASLSPSDAPASGANSGSCGGAAVTAIVNHAPTADPVKVTVIGGCHEASIETSLTKADVTAALAICDAAAEVGYVDGVSSITVTGSDGHELAAGLKGSPCIGEP